MPQHPTNQKRKKGKDLKTKMQLMKDAKSKLLYLLPTRRKDIKQ
jgi:hypothetical protein